VASTRLQLGFREARRPSIYRYDPALFELNGRYGMALEVLSNLFCNRRFHALLDDERRLAFQIVHHCEEARRWRSLPSDLARMRLEDMDNVAEAFDDAAKIVQKLKRIEARHPYFFRHAFKNAFEEQIPEATPLDVQDPDPNHPDGGTRYMADSPTRAHIQHTLAWEIALFKLPNLFSAFEKALKSRKRVSHPFYQIGCLRFEPPLSRKAGVKVRGDAAGLGAWLAYLLREWTAGRGVHPYWPGTKMPEDGRPCWAIVAEFINAALPSDKIETAESVRQQWHTLAKGRAIRLDPWPVEAVREPQAI
jgi:hypothetical protein